MICRTCGQPARHWLWWDRRRPLRMHLTIPTCSLFCMIVLKETRKMIDANEAERRALADAGDAGGGFIETLGQSDMATWTETNWRDFVEVIVTSYVDSLINQQAEVSAATAKVRAA